ncbi:hypothetical protein [Polymorphospora rubra]|uniref:Uncharacterized protein n=1 Tax=Polymorphospora rubra TaxID=338584 RepID=A0A810N8D2_9ACTN|nr:hypothetical protein [Polymorphospora rubra]BCJ69666.1 hypothetical protein Prubr_66870 [Polymorphospora rubra]
MADLKNIALTVEAAQIVNELGKSFGISEQMDTIRLGFAYAVQQDADLNRDLGTRGGSNYDSGGLDNEGLMAATVKVYYAYPEVQAEPYRAVEVLMNKGVRLLKEHLRDGTVGTLGDLVDVDQGK